MTKHVQSKTQSESEAAGSAAEQARAAGCDADTVARVERAEKAGLNLKKLIQLGLSAFEWLQNSGLLDLIGGLKGGAGGVPESAPK